MSKLAAVRQCVALHAIQQLTKRARMQSGLLRLTHFRRRYHLHRASDLRSVADRPYATADVTQAGHTSTTRFRLPTLERIRRRRISVPPLTNHLVSSPDLCSRAAAFSEWSGIPSSSPGNP